MQHLHSLEEATLDQPSVLTIGAFDGVHRGHQYLLNDLVTYAADHDLVPIVLTFHPHPNMVLGGFEPGFYLTLPDQRAMLLGKLGVKIVITHPFNDEVRHIRAADYLTRLLEHLKMHELWVGGNFAMGYQREGNIHYLREASDERDFRLRVVDLMDAGGERVSSTRTREALSQGDVAEVARLLGRPYRVPGTVIEGDKRGRLIGFPTANMDVAIERAIPKRGVYAAWAVREGEQQMPAVVNIGRRPTFKSDDQTLVEAHLLGFEGDLYGQPLALDFVERLRDEMKFSGMEALAAQIDRDIEQGRAALGG